MSNNKVIILFGTGRSGSTILMEALFRHPELAYFSTLLEKYPSLLKLNYFRFLFDNKFYRVFGRKNQLYNTSLFNRLIFKPSEAYPIWRYLCNDREDFSRDFLFKRTASEETKDRIRSYISQILHLQLKSKFALKITGPGRLTFLKSVFPDAKFIWLKRDFIPTLSSFLKVDFWRGRSVGELWWNGPYTPIDHLKINKIKNDSVLLTAFQLNKLIESITCEIRYLGLDVHEIDYKEFVLNPQNTLMKTLDYCGLYLHSDCFKYLEQNQIVNRDKSNSSYFDRKKLKEIEELLKTGITR